MKSWMEDIFTADTIQRRRRKVLKSARVTSSHNLRRGRTLTCKVQRYFSTTVTAFLLELSSKLLLFRGVIRALCVNLSEGLLTDLKFLYNVEKTLLKFLVSISDLFLHCILSIWDRSWPEETEYSDWYQTSDWRRAETRDRRLWV